MRVCNYMPQANKGKCKGRPGTWGRGCLGTWVRLGTWERSDICGNSCHTSDARAGVCWLVCLVYLLVSLFVGLFNVYFLFFAFFYLLPVYLCYLFVAPVAFSCIYTLEAILSYTCRIDGKTCRYCRYICAIFSLAVLIFWLYTRKLAKDIVILSLC